MGVFVTRNNDRSLFVNAVNETFSIIQSSEIIQLSKTKRNLFQPKNKKPNETNKKTKPKRGYCIRCEERIIYDVEKPFCWDCFATWYQFENPEYEENVCHSCGEFESTSMNKPECYECFKENK